MTGLPKNFWASAWASRAGAEALSGEDEAVGEEEVALPLVHLLGVVHRGVAGGPEPVQVRRTFGRSLGVAEPRAEYLAVDDGGAVGRVDHVGQAGNGLDEIHAVAQPLVESAQPFPLDNRERGVDRLGGFHPRVDRVADREVGRSAHQVVARCRGPAGGAAFGGAVGRDGVHGAPFGREEGGPPWSRPTRGGTGALRTAGLRSTQDRGATGFAEDRVAMRDRASRRGGHRSDAAAEGGGDCGDGHEQGEDEHRRPAARRAPGAGPPARVRGLPPRWRPGRSR